MLIVCPSCATSYQVEHSSLGAGGRSVRCTRCRDVWFATAPTLVPALASVDDLDVVDTGPKVPAYDVPRPPEPEPPVTEPPPFDAAAPYEQSEAVPEEIPQPTAAPEEMAFDEAAPEQTATEGNGPEPASTEGIDIEGLSAEIEAEHAQQAAAADAVLAEVTTGEITVADAPSLDPPLAPAEPPQTLSAVPIAGLAGAAEAFNAHRARSRQARRRQSNRWPVPGLPTIILALIAANMILVAWRIDIVRLLPQTASLYAAVGLPVNLRGMAFENIKMSKEQQDGMTVLLVEGSIVNVTSRAVEVPRVRLAVRNDSKNEIYSWTTLPTRTVLGPGETLPFRSRLASPPAEARDVMVRFFSRRDIVAGLR